MSRGKIYPKTPFDSNSTNPLQQIIIDSQQPYEHPAFGAPQKTKRKPSPRSKGSSNKKNPF